MIADELISEIRERTDIVSLIGEFVELKQRGANFVGLCPFHNEKSPSFNVRRDRQFFHCFGCQESGDALQFLMRLEGLSFPAAARQLAERAGIEIKDSDDREDAARKRERQLAERLCALTEAAAAFYVEQLRAQPEDSPARRELASRGVSAETAEEFRLGYAPASWDALTHHLHQKGHSIQDAEQLGLIAASKKGRARYYDRFRHRLMFPVTDLHGRMVAFSGRLLASADTPRTEEPKYVNSPESAIYKKGALLFGLHQARVEIRRNGWAILCEGNFDLVALHQAGFRNAVAPLGTAFTETQARLLRRFAQRVTLMFDADTAGRKAVSAAVPLLRASELAARVAPLPVGADPDSFLRERGAEAMRQLVDAAPGIVEYLIDAAAENMGTSAVERANAIGSLGPVMVAVGNPVEVELYIQRIARRFSITDLRVVKEQLRQGVQAAKQPQRQSQQQQAETTTKLAPKPGRVKLPQLQSSLLGTILDKPALFRSQYAETLRELLTVEELQSIFSAAAAQFAERGTLDASRLLADLAGNPALDWLKERLSVELFADDAKAETELRSGIPRLAKENIERELPQLAQRAQLARQRGDENEANILTRQHIELSKHANQLVKGVKR